MELLTELRSQSTPRVRWTSLIKKAAAVSRAIATQSPKERALLLRTIAAEIEAVRTSLIESACAETALPEARIGGEITLYDSSI